MGWEGEKNGGRRRMGEGEEEEEEKGKWRRREVWRQGART